MAELTVFTTSADGNVSKSGTVYATVQAATTGDTVAASDTILQTPNYFSTPNYTVGRIFFYFDTSALGATSTISSATMSVYGHTGQQETNVEFSNLRLYEGTQSDSLVVADYDNFGAEALSDSFTNWEYPLATNAYSTITLNAAGLALINKTGITKFCGRIVGDITPAEPTGANQAIIWSNEKGTGYQPKLVITYLPIYELSCTDGLKAGDSPSNIANMNNALADGVKLSDSAVMGFFYLLAAVDGLKVSDSALYDHVMNFTLADGVKLSESLSTMLQTYPIVTDGAKLSETLATLKQTFPSLSDGAKLSDAAVHFLTLSLLASDGIKLSEALATQLQTYPVAIDGVKISDTASFYEALVIYALLELYSRALIAKLHRRDATVIQEE